MIFSILTPSIEGLYRTLSMTLSITDTQHNNSLYYADRHYAECSFSYIGMMSVIMLNGIILSAVAPFNYHSSNYYLALSKISNVNVDPEHYLFHKFNTLIHVCFQWHSFCCSCKLSQGILKGEVSLYH